jgi:ribosomal protein S18 acetylase RimI-like enzyme
VLIRAATAADAEAVARLWTEAYSGRREGEGRVAPYEEREFFEASGRGQAFVAELEGAAVGTVVLCSAGTPGLVVAGEREAELSRLAVAVAARGQGIGRALAQVCAEQARLEGARALALWSRPYQHEAHRLYLSLGYRRAPERDSETPQGARQVFLLALPASYT